MLTYGFGHFDRMFNEMAAKVVLEHNVELWKAFKVSPESLRWDDLKGEVTQVREYAWREAPGVVNTDSDVWVEEKPDVEGEGSVTIEMCPVRIESLEVKKNGYGPYDVKAVVCFAPVVVGLDKERGKKATKYLWSHMSKEGFVYGVRVEIDGRWSMNDRDEVYITIWEVTVGDKKGITGMRNLYVYLSMDDLLNAAYGTWMDKLFMDNRFAVGRVVIDI